MAMNNDNSLDAFSPTEIAAKAEKAGIVKANKGFFQLFLLAVLAGAFIAFGSIFCTNTVTGASDLPYGVTKLLGGLVFSLGLILVVVAGAELFTGNNLIVMACASGKISLWQVLRNWVIVYVGNFIGSVAIALLVFFSGHYKFGGGQIGLTALNIANGKAGLGFVEALFLGILCNVLVCLAVWLTMSGRTTSDKILAIIFPITAFVAAGFEHSVANMYFLPFGWMIKNWAPAEFWNGIGKAASDFGNLEIGDILLNNLLPVTIGNIIGGALLIGGIYWLIFLHKSEVY